jgi:choline dehydrogenase
MVETGARVDHLVFDGRRCVGVRYRQGGTVREARAEGEVVLAAGSINSPQVLELSGVGRPEILAAHGVAVRHPLPGVGENLRDHAAPRMMWRIQRRGVTYNDRARGLGMAWQALRYALRRDGFLAMPAAPMMAFLRTRAGLETPDFQLVFIPFLADRTALRKRRLAREAGMVIVGCQLRPESTGSVHVQSPDPAAAPAIRLNLLATAFDRETTIAGIRQARRLMAAAPLDSFRGPELQPGPGVQSDADLLGWLRETVETMYHPVGTCRMGQDEGAVVDHELRVRGLSGLRVADASIMPTLVSGNTHAASMMIGEKAAAMILAARR